MQSNSERAYRDVVCGLQGLGYGNALLQEDYGFLDWFAPKPTARRIAAAAFGESPVSYESACIGVARANGIHGAGLVDEYKSLGAPVILEVGNDFVSEWLVSRSKDSHVLVAKYPANRINQLFVDRATYWKPSELLRAKNIGKFEWTRQLKLFSGLLPELEEHIQESLGPLLKQALYETKETYKDSTGREAHPEILFKLVFALLTAKVFHDRQLAPFSKLGPSADDLLSAVAKHYGKQPQKLLNQSARDAATKIIWSDLDFRNLSVEVLSQMWYEILVDDATKKSLGIHRTSRTIVRYILERIPFETTDDERIILEPCCGSAVFLVGAMNRLRQNLFGMPAEERHQYFIKHLVGIEKDPFGVEISRLALTLADFPCANGWTIEHADVFKSPIVASYLNRAGVVLCNPPFESFNDNERTGDQISVKKPVELLDRVLKDLHPRGVLGFVLPSSVVDGRGYATVRRKLAERFASLEFTNLPDCAFKADHESVLMIAKDPIPHEISQISVRDVSKKLWHDFETSHTTGEKRAETKTPLQAGKGFDIPEMAEVWNALKDFHTVADCANIRRGIEWNKPLTEKGQETGFRKFVVSKSPARGFIAGVAPQAKTNIFESPETCFLNIESKWARGNAYLRPWFQPKVIVNKTRRSRSAWKTAAFPDEIGLACYQTFFGIWPTKCADISVLSAIINSPLANLFIDTHEKRQDITMETLGRIPMPYITEVDQRDIGLLVTRYQQLVKFHPPLFEEARHALLEIDARVLRGYKLSAHLEHKILERFQHASRATPFEFGAYLDGEDSTYFSLYDRISARFMESTASALLRRMAIG